MTSSNSKIDRLAAAIIKNPKLLYEQVLEQNVHTGSITLPLVYPKIEKDNGTIVTIPFVMIDDFSFSLGNTWNTVMPEDINNIASTITGWYNALTTLGDAKKTQEIDSQISWQNKLASIANYQSSKMPQFSVSLMFVCTQRSYNPSEIVKTLSAMCLPVKYDLSKAQTATKLIHGGVEKISSLLNTDENKDNLLAKGVGVISSGINKMIDGVSRFTENNEFAASAKNMLDNFIDNIHESVMMAPLYYQAVYDKGVHKAVIKSGGITLQIGKWFKADNLICTDISGITFSKETIAPPPEWLGTSNYSSIYSNLKDHNNWGFPLYAKCTVTLRPCSLITYEDFCQYFIQTSGNTTAKADSLLGYAADNVKSIFKRGA